ncbi:hypothetical protein [Streptomyces sp. TP-A0874]|uniref:hypothetical protein n=1 Tax=Streptomyces sp. TP-A0874 TaxID=549819 RepID=UPI00085379AD
MLFPASASPAAPLVLISPPPLGLHKTRPRLAGRAQYHAAEYGFAAATVEHPGRGDRPVGPPPSGPAPTCAGHTGVPRFELDALARYFARHPR